MTKMRTRVISVALAVALVAMAAFALGGCKAKVENKDDALPILDAGGVAETDPFYVLIVGNDGRKGTYQESNPNYSDGTARSDVIMLARINPQDYSIALISAPRDTRTTVNGSETKLNESYHVNGMDGLKASIEELAGVKIKYTMDIGFTEFEKFVDALGGLKVNVPVPMGLKDIVSGEWIDLVAGEQNLDGKQALVLARTRKVYEGDMDAARQVQDRQIVQRGIQQVAADPVNAAKNVQILANNAKTDWPLGGLAKTVANFAENADKITFVSGTGPYEGGEEDPTSGLWLIPRDTETWAKVIAAAEAGESMTEIVPEPEIALRAE